MEESGRHKFKEYFYFLKQDRNGIIVIVLLIILTIGGHFIIDKIEVSPNVDITEMVKAFEAWENETGQKNQSLSFFYFDPNTVSQEQFDSLSIPVYIKNNILKYRSAGGYFVKSTDLKKIYGMNDSIYALIEPWVSFPAEPSTVVEKNVVHVSREIGLKINPNITSTDELIHAGFNSFQASNIEKYRKTGGRFNKPEDLLKIFGIDSTFFFSVRANIQIEDTLSYFVDETTSANQKVDLNTADSVTLVQLKGIGPVFASRIIKYRKLLGGFHSVKQLLEVYGFPEETFENLQGNFVVDSLHIKKMRINFAEYADLIRHPYIEKEDVEEVLSYRNKNGPFLSNEQLLTEGLLDSASYERLKPYITCR